LLGTNLRVEMPLLNSRLRKNYLSTNKHLPVYSLGLSIDYLTYPVINMGNSILSLKNLLEGKNNFLRELCLGDFFSLSLLNFRFIPYNAPKIFIGSAFLNRVDGNSVFNAVTSAFGRLLNGSLSSSYLNVISHYLGKISASEIGFLPSINTNYAFNNKLSFSYLCGVDNFSVLEPSAFLVYQGIFKANNYL
jgi:hypothetical protein